MTGERINLLHTTRRIMLICNQHRQ